jgi:mono/diheme cytochrome c family protein
VKTGLPRPGTEGSGGWVPDDTLPFKVYAPNISPDRETGAGTRTDEQFVGAIRQGIGHDGRTLIGFDMPYLELAHLSDEDLAAVIAYIRSIPPVRHKVPRTVWPEEFRELYRPLPPTGPVPRPDMSDPVKRGRYLTTIAGCAGCHTPLNERLEPLPGLDFAGGLPLYGPWGKVASANITPDPSGIPYYDEAMFLRTIRTGRVNGVRPLNQIMLWKYFRNMTDEDLRAIFAYLRTLRPVRHRVDNTERPTPCRLCGGVHGYGDRN